MTTVEFKEFVESLPEEIPLDIGNGIHRTIRLRTLAKDVEMFHDFREWWKSKNMPPHLSNAIAKAILGQNPPENVRNALLFLML